MFVDSVKLVISSGKGGDGAVSFKREKFMPKGGPDGGDGGDGGNVYLLVDNNADTLYKYKNKRVLKAGNGAAGMGLNKSGKRGEDLVLKIPAGTLVVDVESEDILHDLTEVGKKVLFLSGGKGGLGNTRFKSSTNQKPTFYRKGKVSTTKEVKFELKLVADVGLVGFPNIGKSTLISTITNSKPKISDYSFTTLTPNLGEVRVGSFDSFILADIPGIIEGASDGKGLGIEFLKHIERTKVLLFVIDISSESLIEIYNRLWIELKRYSKNFMNKKFAIILSKADLFTIEETKEKLVTFFKELNIDDYSVKDDFYIVNSDYSNKYDISKPYFVSFISSATNINLEALKINLYKMVKQ